MGANLSPISTSFASSKFPAYHLIFFSVCLLNPKRQPQMCFLTFCHSTMSGCQLGSIQPEISVVSQGPWRPGPKMAWYWFFPPFSTLRKSKKLEKQNHFGQTGHHIGIIFTCPCTVRPPLSFLSNSIPGLEIPFLSSAISLPTLPL